MFNIEHLKFNLFILMLILRIKIVQTLCSLTSRALSSWIELNWKRKLIEFLHQWFWRRNKIIIQVQYLQKTMDVKRLYILEIIMQSNFEFWKYFWHYFSIKLARIIGEYMSPRTMCIKRFLCNSNKPIRKIFQCAILANELTVETWSMSLNLQ